MDLRIAVLGPIEVERDGEVLKISGAKERALLATLAVRAGWLLTTEQLIDVLWADDPPATALSTLRSYISRLRRVVGESIVGRGGGYALDLPDDCVDAKRFEQLVEEGTSGGRPAALTEALRLWRGAPLPDLAESARGQAEARRLHELRITAVIGHAEWQLAIGDTTRVIGLLEREVAEHPYREPLWALLVRALVDAGRRADALLAYQRARTVLVDGLGLDPGPELQAAEALALADPPPPATTSDRQAGPAFHVALREAPLIGRDAELATLREVWRVAEGGRTSWATVIGEGGMGKTRLLAELAAMVENSGGIALFGYGDPALPLPFGPLVTATQPLVSASMTAIRPELDALYGGGDAAELGRLGDGQRLRLHRGINRLLTDAATTAPVCLLLDDLHSVDEATIGTLRHLLRLPVPHLAVVISSRPPDPSSPAAALLDELAGLGSQCRLVLGPLQREAATQIADRHLADPGAAHEVVERAGGCPLLVVELARSPRVADGLPRRAEVSAETLAAVQRRLSGLPDDALSSLRAAAIFGRRFELEALGLVRQRSIDELALALDQVVAREVLEESDDRLGHYSFSHEVVAEALLATMGRNALAVLHRTAADALATLASGPHDPRWIGAAHHLDAGGGHDPAVFRAAGKLAARRGDHRSAIRWFSCGLDGSDVDGLDRIELLMGLGEAYDRQVESGARAAYLEAIDIASTMGANRQLVEAVLGLTRYNQARVVARADEAVLAAIELARDRCDPDDLRVGALLAAAQCAELMWTAPSRRRRELRDRAVDAARQLDDPSLLGEVAGLTYFSAGAPDDAEERREIAGRALRTMPVGASDEAAILARLAAAYAAFELGDVSQADRLANEADELVRGHHHQALAWRVTTVRVALAMFHHELDLAEELIGAVASEARSVGSPQDMLVARALGQLAVERDDLEPLAPVLDVMVAGPTVEGWRSARAYVLAALGRTEEAGSELIGLVDGIPRASRTVGWLTHRCGEALAASMLGDASSAETLAETLTPFRDRLCIDVIASMGPVALAAGRAWVTAGRPEIGCELLEQAIAICRTANAPNWEARAKAALHAAT